MEDAVPEALDAVHDSDDPAVLALVRVLAGLALLRDLARRVAAAHAALVERSELAETSVRGREQRDQQVDDEHAEADATAANGEPAAHATAANIGDLAGVEPGVAPKTHEACLPRLGGSQAQEVAPSSLATALDCLFSAAFFAASSPTRARSLRFAATTSRLSTSCCSSASRAMRFA